MLPWFQNDSFPLYLAPMAGFTDTVYRQLCKREGADVMVSEFVMSDSVNLDQDNVWETVDFTEDQRPIGIQIFGASAESMSEAARRIVDRLNPDFIDLNFGCPSEKVTCQEAGASLLRHPDRLVNIASAVVKALPDSRITAKIRLGWDEQNLVAEALAPRLQDAGIQALTIHGRTKVQGYTGEADWDAISRVAEQVEIPIIGNGSIRNSGQVYRIKTASRIKGIMIGRAALGYPWIFNEIKAHLATGKKPLPPSLEQRWNTIFDYARLLSTRPMRKNEQNYIMWMRPRLAKLTKDMLGCKPLRHQINQVVYLEDLHRIAEKHIARYAHVEQRIFERLSA